MENLENNNTTTGGNGDLQLQLNSLRQLVNSALVLIFILAGAVNIYFWRQLRSVQTELAPLQKQSTQIMAEVTKVNSVANDFARKLIDYGKTHPDFQPILNKYNLREIPNTNAAGAAKTPAPAPAKK